MKNIKYILSGLVVLVVVLGGVVFSSKNASPESPIYTVRINVLEKLTEMTKSDEYAKGEYALTLGGQRLADLEVLKTKQMLDTVEGNMARDNFNQQTIAIQGYIIYLSGEKGFNNQEVLQLSENLDVLIEKAKIIFNIDQLEVVDEGVPVEKNKSTQK